MKQHVVLKTTLSICIYYNIYSKKSTLKFETCTSGLAQAVCLHQPITKENRGSPAFCKMVLYSVQRITVPVFPFSASFTLSNEVI